MHLSLLVPAPFTTVSGGYEYDRRIVAGLRAAGHQVDVVEIAAGADAAAALAAVPLSSRPVIDGLLLPEFHIAADLLAQREAVGLIHHPVSLETGLDPAEAVRLGDVERALFARLPRLIATSPRTGQQLTDDYGVPAERVRVVTPGTDDLPRSSGSAAGCALLSVATLLPRKGHDVLLRALARLTDLEWTLTIVGNDTRDAACATALRDLTMQLGLDARVRFTGEQTGAALDALWQAADIFSLATWWEGYGMVVAEALKRGLPVAVTSGGAAAALMTSDAGIVCPPGDVEQLSKALRRMIFDRALRTDMAQAAWSLGQALPGWAAQAADFAKALDMSA